MLFLELRPGVYAIVDDDAPEEVTKYKWSLQNGYAARDKDGRRLLLHRELMGAKDGELVDHINGNGLDNRMSNLRFCTQRQNAQNRTRVRGSKKLPKGVTKIKRVNPYRARIVVDGKEISLGCYATPEEAAAAYDAAALFYFGLFAATNAK